MNIPNPTGAQAWRTGYEDGTHGRQDAAFYNRDDDDARCYRDGHRMARRELADREKGEATTPAAVTQPIDTTAATWPAAVTPEAEKIVAAQIAANFEKAPVPSVAEHVAAELNKIWDKGLGGTPSSFVDPTPGKRRAKQPKPPADRGQQSLF